MVYGQRLLMVAAVAALVLAGTCALHADDGQAQDFFDRLDANNDGRIDRDEFKGPDDAFARMDRNGDGAISRDEVGGDAQGDQPGAFRPGQGGQREQMDPAQRWQKMLERFDQNGDGKISSEEFKGPEKVLRFLDANNDGEITEDEALQAADRGRDRGQMDPAERWKRLIDNCDANADGKISQDEWPARAEMFQRLDRNGDGQLTQDEMPQGRPGADPAGGPNRQQVAQLIERHDADGDGKLSREEWPRSDEMFDQLDADGDAFITEADLAQLADRRPERQDPARLLIGLMDKDGDGQVSAQEWSNFFNAVDVDADGMMSQPELLAHMKNTLRPEGDAGPPEAPPAPEEGF